MPSASETHDLVEKNLKDHLKWLLETKHLYQSTTLDLQVGLNRDLARPWKAKIAQEKWGIHDNALSPSSTVTQRIFMSPYGLPTSSCFVTNASVSRHSTRSQVRNLRETAITRRDTSRFRCSSRSFLCQSCKGIPEVFLIRREGLKLILSGRAPMEVADVPTVIPKTPKDDTATLLGGISGPSIRADSCSSFPIAHFSRAMGTLSDKRSHCACGCTYG